ncbi:hypothetical protein DE149_11315 [Micrococcus sp. KT16]|nr:hypothetical protein DE149_11315 [Micrococcus sp. KT16]
MTSETAPREWWEHPDFIGPTITVYCDDPRHRGTHRAVATFGLAEVPTHRIGEFRHRRGEAHDRGRCSGTCWTPEDWCHRTHFWAVRTPLMGELRHVLERIEQAGELTEPGLLDALYLAHGRQVQRDAQVVSHAGNVQATGEVPLAHVAWIAVAREMTEPWAQRDPYYHPLWGDGYAGRNTRYSYQYAPRNSQVAALHAPGPRVHYMPRPDREEWPIMYRQGIGLVCDRCQRQERSTKGRNSKRVDVSHARLYVLLDRAHAEGVRELPLHVLRRMNSQL